MPEENQSQINLNWYRPGTGIAEFHQSLARIRALIGGRGSGKTTAIAVETVSHSFHNAGAKTYILRKTQLSNTDTTLETFEQQVFPNLGTGYTDTGTSLFKKIDGGRVYRLPSRKAIEFYNKWQTITPNATKAQKEMWLESVGNRFCSWVYFAGVPEERYRASRFRGYECSLLIFVEADQLANEDLRLGVACLRWKGADPDTCDDKGFIIDSGVILDTNPPSPRHWIAVMEAESKGAERWSDELLRMESQDPSIRFWHLKTKDNAHNLPDNYVQDLEKQYKSNPAMLRRMLHGEYAEAFDGQRVLFEFQELHAQESLPWPKGAYLVRGWDFGTTQAVVWSAYWLEGGVEYWWDLHEFFARQSDAERQCRSVLEITQKVFPFWNDRNKCSGVKDYCDIAGNQQKDTGSSVAVLRSYGIFPGFMKMGLQESLAVYNRLLQKRNQFASPVYQIDKVCCPMLYIASIGGYRYPVEGEPGFGGDQPLKGPAGGDYDHIADASRYAKFNCLRLIRAEVEKLNKPIGVLGETPALNNKKRWW